MFFTQEDYRKIEDYLKRKSVKDSELTESLPLIGEESVAIVQDGHNKKVNIKDFTDYLFNFRTSDFINVTDRFNIIGNIEETIQAIPFTSRKIGQVITFKDIDNNWYIYQYKSNNLTQWLIPDAWDNILDIASKEVSTYDVDNEDLCLHRYQSNGEYRAEIKFKDKVYNKEDFSGLGKKILRKNKVEINSPQYGKVTKNILTQKDFDEPNTILVIKYDFDLNNKKIILREGTVLEYDGGSLKNGTIVSNDNLVLGNELLDSTIKVEGRFTYLNKVSVNEEDIHLTEDSTIEFSNKKYDSLSFGRIYIRKNEPIKTQIKDNPNTIFIFRDNIDLNGEDIIIPDNSILKFEGGKLSNGNLYINDSILIDSPAVQIFNNVYLYGSYSEDFKVAWCGCIPNNPTIDSTKMLEYTFGLGDNNLWVYPLLTYEFEKGKYYFSELLLPINGVTFKGKEAGSFGDCATQFAPFGENQNYIIKLGGSKYGYSEKNEERRANINILDICFTSDAKTFLNKENTEGLYSGGLLVIERLQVGKFRVHFSNGGEGEELSPATVPPLYIGGSSYELVFDSIVCYTNYGKSDNPVIYFGEKRFAAEPTSATIIHKLMVETIDGPIIRQPSGYISELIIDDVTYEGIAAFGHPYCHVVETIPGIKDLDYFGKDRDSKYEEFKNIKKVPLFEFTYSQVIIGNISFNRVGNTKYINDLDNDGAYKTNSLFKFSNLGYINKISIGTILYDFCQFLGIEGTGQRAAPDSELTISNILGFTHSDHKNCYLYVNNAASTVDIQNYDGISNILPKFNLNDSITANSLGVIDVKGSLVDFTGCRKQGKYNIYYGDKPIYDSIEDFDMVNDKLLQYHKDCYDMIYFIKTPDEDSYLKINITYQSSNSITVLNYNKDINSIPEETTYELPTEYNVNKFRNYLIPIPGNSIIKIKKGEGEIWFNSGIFIPRNFGSTDLRPKLGVNDKGFMYYDTTLVPSKHVVWDGEKWNE